MHSSCKILGAILIFLTILIAATPPTLALAPAKVPQWKVNDNWKYQGTYLWTNISVSLNVTGKGDISIDSTTYHAYTLEFYIKATLGLLTYTLSGKWYYDQTDYSLIKTETTTVEKGQIKDIVVIYDPPARQVNFPLEFGKEWNDERTVTTVQTINGIKTKTVTNESDTYRVDGTDSIVTPGGAIECYRISVTNKTGHASQYWYSAQVGQFVKLDIIPTISNNYVILTDFSYTPPHHGTSNPGPSMMTLAIVTIIILVVVMAIVAAAVGSRRGSRSPIPPTTMQTTPGPAPSAAPIAQPAPQPPKPAGMIEDVFLIYRDGRLIHHDARRLKPEVDQDVLGGMLTAIQDFVSRSFPSSDGTVGAVKEIRYANSRILIEKGQFLYMAVVTDFQDIASLQARMVSLLKLMEVKCAKDLQNWDGNMETVSETKRLARFMLTEDLLPVA